VTPDLSRWPAADDLLDEALALPAAQRPEFLKKMGGHDPDLLTALEAVLAEAGRDDGFLEPGGALSGELGDEISRALDDLPPTGLVLTPGARIEHYEILELLGRGGMAEVYRARDSRLNRDVALKVLPLGFAQDAERAVRFRREARVLAALNHPGIGAIYGVAEQGDVRALVLEYVAGVTLADRIAGGPLSVTEALAIARQVADAIKSAHAQGILHRDLKPANIMLQPRDGDIVAKVLDFGLAKALTPAPDDTTMQQLTQDSPFLLGTAAYMSPEQIRRATVTERADLWAFGCVVFEMLTGVRAFPGSSVTEVLPQVMNGEPDFTRLPADTPVSVRRLLQRALDKDARQRIGTMADAIIEIDEAATRAVATAAPRSSWTERVVGLLTRGWGSRARRQVPTGHRTGPPSS
jgi:eukaryotic-like serine/threonine-protein kinase